MLNVCHYTWFLSIGTILSESIYNINKKLYIGIFDNIFNGTEKTKFLTIMS